MNFKEFLEDCKVSSDLAHNLPKEDLISVKALGEYYWNRGGKLLVQNFLKDKKDCVWFCQQESLEKHAKYVLESCGIFDGYYGLWASDFLDAVACLGEKNIKKRISEMK